MTNESSFNTRLYCVNQFLSESKRRFITISSTRRPSALRQRPCGIAPPDGAAEEAPALRPVGRRLPHLDSDARVHRRMGVLLVRPAPLAHALVLQLANVQWSHRHVLPRRCHRAHVREAPGVETSEQREGPRKRNGPTRLYRIPLYMKRTRG